MSASTSRLVRNLDWNLLKTFHEIAEAGNISRAAQYLSRKQPAVSLALKRLEESLGTTLCQRGSGGLRLTDHGVVVAEVASKLLMAFEEMEHRLRDASAQIAGSLRLFMISNIVVPELDRAIAAFRLRFPAVHIAIEIGAMEAVGRALLQGDADIGISSDQLRRPQLQYDPLFREVQRAYCGRSFHLFGKHVPRLDALEEEPFISPGIDEPLELVQFRNRHGLGRRTAGSANHLDEVRRLIQLGIGIGFLPERMAEPDIAAGQLWPLGTEHAGWGANIFLITHPEAPRRMIRRLFIAEIIAQRQAEAARDATSD